MFRLAGRFVRFLQVKLNRQWCQMKPSGILEHACNCDLNNNNNNTIYDVLTCPKQIVPFQKRCYDSSVQYTLCLGFPHCLTCYNV